MSPNLTNQPATALPSIKSKQSKQELCHQGSTGIRATAQMCCVVCHLMHQRFVFSFDGVPVQGDLHIGCACACGRPLESSLHTLTQSGVRRHTSLQQEQYHYSELKSVLCHHIMLRYVQRKSTPSKQQEDALKRVCRKGQRVLLSPTLILPLKLGHSQNREVWVYPRLSCVERLTVYSFLFISVKRQGHHISEHVNTEK